MRLLSLKASKVHGHLNFDYQINNDVSFLVGPNGSGKSTAPDVRNVST